MGILEVIMDETFVGGPFKAGHGARAWRGRRRAAAVTADSSRGDQAISIGFHFFAGGHCVPLCCVRALVSRAAMDSPGGSQRLLGAHAPSLLRRGSFSSSVARSLSGIGATSGLGGGGGGGGGGGAGLRAGSYSALSGAEAASSRGAVVAPPLDAATLELLAWLRRGAAARGLAGAWLEEHDTAAAAFLTTPELRKLIAYTSAGGALVLLSLPGGAVLPAAPADFVYWLRREPGSALTPRNARAALVCGAVIGGAGGSLLRLVESVYLMAVAGAGSGGGAAGSDCSSGSGGGGGGAGGNRGAGGSAGLSASARTEFVGQAHRLLASLVEARCSTGVRWARGDAASRGRPDCAVSQSAPLRQPPPPTLFQP